MASYMMTPALLGPAQSMMPPASAFPPAPEAPAASASRVPQATGGLGGLGGLIRDPMFGDTLNALFTSIATSPRNNMLANFGALQNNAIDRRRLMTADAQKTQQNALETEAMKQALKAAGFSDAEAEQMAVNPQAAQVMLDQRKAQAAAQARREFMAQMPSLDGGDSASRVPQMQMVPQTDAAAGGMSSAVPAGGRVDGLMRMRAQLVQRMAAAPDDDSRTLVKGYIDQVDAQIKQAAPTDTQTNLEWRAQQAGLQPGTQEYRDFMLKGGAGPLVQIDTAPKLPTGYQWIDPNRPDLGVKPIPGGPATQIPSEAAGRIGLADTFLKNFDAIKQSVESGAVTGPIDAFRARNDSSSTGAETYRQIQTGVDALQRMLTGAGMPASEAANYAYRYLPTYTDDAGSMVKKLDRLKSELENVKTRVMQGRGEDARKGALSEMSDEELEAIANGQ